MGIVVNQVGYLTSTAGLGNSEKAIYYQFSSRLPALSNVSSKVGLARRGVG
jgi:hypothetical protein